MEDCYVKVLCKEECKIWDDFVQDSPIGTIFHLSDYLSICSKEFNLKLKIFGIFKNEQLIGGCSLFENKSRLPLKIASSTCRMTPYGGVVFKKSKSTKIRERESFQKGIINTLCNYFKKENYFFISLINSPDLIDIREFIYDQWKEKVRYAYYVKLEGDIFSNFSTTARTEIKKAINNGLKIKRTNDPDLFYDLFSMTFERQNMKVPVSKQIINDMLTLIENKNIGGMWVAELPSQDTAYTGIVLWDNKRAYGWAAGSDTNNMKLGGASLLQYSLFTDLKQMGLKEINVLGANTPQLSKFFSTFNPVLVPYYSVEKFHPNISYFEKLKNVITKKLR